MKTTLISIILTAGSLCHAQNFIKIPVLVEMNNKIIHSSEVNKKYNLSGKEALPEFLKIYNQKSAEKVASYQSYLDEKKIPMLNKKLGTDFNLVYQVDVGTSEDSLENSLKTCYSGVPEKAIGLVADMISIVYSEQLQIFVWKYKDTTRYFYEEVYGESFDEDTKQELEDKSLKSGWNKKSEDILIMSDYGDSGDNPGPSILRKCN